MASSPGRGWQYLPGRSAVAGSDACQLRNFVCRQVGCELIFQFAHQSLAGCVQLKGCRFRGKAFSDPNGIFEHID